MKKIKNFLINCLKEDLFNPSITDEQAAIEDYLKYKLEQLNE